MSESHSVPSPPKGGALSNEEAGKTAELRPWPVRALTFLLVVEGVGLVVIAYFNLRSASGIGEILAEQSFFAVLPPLGVLAGIAAIGFYHLRPGAWVTAMLVQGLLLLVTLLVYFRNGQDDFFIYGLMAFAIVMVIYLNYAQVPAVFRVQPGQSLEER